MSTPQSTGVTQRHLAIAEGRVQKLLDEAQAYAERHGIDGGAEAAIFDAVAELGPLGKVARRFGTNRAAVNAWIRSDPARLRPLLEEARRDAAPNIAEDAGEVLEELDQKEELSNAHVSLANSRSNYLRWLAGIYDDKFSDKRNQAQITLNVGELHLDALRAEGTRRIPVVVAESVDAPGEEGGTALVEFTDAEDEAWTETD